MMHEERVNSGAGLLMTSRQSTEIQNLFSTTSHTDIGQFNSRQVRIKVIKALRMSTTLIYYPSVWSLNFSFKMLCSIKSAFIVSKHNSSQ